MKNIRFALFAGAVGCALTTQVPAAEAAKAAEAVLHSFGVASDGVQPQANLFQMKGALYGTTAVGGLYAGGTVFAVTKTGQENVLYSFCSLKKCTDGGYPLAGVVDVNGMLYGTTSAGGTNKAGSVFSLDPNSGSEQVLHAFGSGTDGAFPEAGLIAVNGTLYGTTQKGGANGNGTVFSLDPGTGTEQVVYSFCSQLKCADGQYPLASLTDVNGTLYGTTQRGGSRGKGTVFTLDPSTGAEQAVYSFCTQQKCADGEYPLATLIDVNGMLYGTTFEGGADEYFGTVFALDPGTGAEQVLHSFCSKANCTDGAYPYAGLTEVNGLLYGTTGYGGASNGGSVFALDPATGKQTVVYSFCGVTKCLDGDSPQASLINVKGTLYGTTQAGGANNFGAVFGITNP
ncbi:MAG TPA: choice-of-anchor tandem repeat GloVer-containing protein [Rhizomicrobium sp.]|jgi:uncharacterized repeat protein (TIGR03803 family)|nr:choice-of-anchor tandem repeat GloVer-containing protein [Rhizomicrobium sp.]